MLAYKSVRNLYVRELRAAERQFYHFLEVQLTCNCLKSRPHYWWNSLKSISGWKSSYTIPLLSGGSQVVLNSGAKPELLNDCFSKQCSNPSLQQVPRIPSAVEPGMCFDFQEVTEVDVTSALRELNVWKSTGLDGLSARSLRECSTELAELLSLVFNLPLAEGI